MEEREEEEEHRPRPCWVLSTTPYLQSFVLFFVLYVFETRFLCVAGP